MRGKRLGLGSESDKRFQTETQKADKVTYLVLCRVFSFLISEMSFPAEAPKVLEWGAKWRKPELISSSSLRVG